MQPHCAEDQSKFRMNWWVFPTVVTNFHVLYLSPLQILFLIFIFSSPGARQEVPGATGPEGDTRSGSTDGPAGESSGWCSLDETGTPCHSHHQLLAANLCGMLNNNDLCIRLMKSEHYCINKTFHVSMSTGHWRPDKSRESPRSWTRHVVPVSILHYSFTIVCDIAISMMYMYLF